MIFQEVTLSNHFIKLVKQIVIFSFNPALKLSTLKDILLSSEQQNTDLGN